MPSHHMQLSTTRFILLAFAVTLLDLPLSAADFSVKNMTDYTYLRFGKYVTQDSLVTYRLHDCGGTVFFAGGTSTFNAEPWVSRGTLATTRKVAEINPSATVGGDPDEFTRVGDYVFFAANDGTNGRELWKTHVTTLATTLVKNIRPGGYSSDPHSLAECNGSLIFSCNADPTVEGDELWISDGTEEGTQLLKDIAPGSNSSHISNPRTIGGLTYFSATEFGTFGSQLWRTDGTMDGTLVIYDTGMSSHAANPNAVTYFAQHDRVCFFVRDANSGNRYALWSTDGTAEGTEVIASPVTDSHTNGGVTAPDRVVELAGRLYFRGGDLATGYELWSSDGTAEGTGMVADIYTGTGGSSLHDLVVFRDKIWFVANDGVRGEQLWCSDGTEAGTALAHEFYNSSQFNPPAPHALEVIGDRLLFKLNTDDYGLEWWSTDGTEFTLVKDLRPGVTDGVSKDSIAYSGEHIVVNGGLYFNGNDPTIMRELFRIGVAPRIEFQPDAIIAAVGEAVGLSIQPAAGSTPSCQWMKNNVKIGGATALDYDIAFATLSHAANYKATLTTIDGSVTSDPIKLAVVNKVLEAPQVAQGGTITLAVSAAAPSGTALTFQWQRGGEDLTNGPTASGGLISGATTSKLKITKASDAEEGLYTCKVGLAPSSLITDAADVKVVDKPTMTNNPVPSAIVSGAFSWQLAASEFPSGFTVSGLPSGLTYNSRSGLVSGIPGVSGSYKIRVTAKNVAGSSSVQEFTLIIGSLPDSAVGSFSGIAARNSGVNATLGGALALTVSKSGSFTGSLRNGTASHAIRGRVVAPLSGNPTASVTIPRKGLPSLTLSLNFATNNIATGSLTDGTFIASLNPRRHVWGGTTALAYAGTYNIANDVPAGSVNDMAQPQGSGYQRMVVASSGKVSGTGRTPDGIAYTFSGTLWPDAALPQFVLLYSGKGSIIGLPQIAIGATLADNRITGYIEHYKGGPASSRDRTYNTGIAVVRRTVDGAPWIKPTAAAPIVLGLPNAAGNANITFSNGAVESAAQFGALAQIFRINQNTTTTFAAAALGNPCKVTMKIISSTGLFSGSCTLTDTVSGRSISRRISYYGILLSHRAEGFGYFLLPGLTPSTTTSPILGGRVVVN
jgi:ELWxxDGT repeat protein